MADKLHNAIRSLSIEDDDPVTLPDDPKFRVFDANATSLMGRLLNPDCQPMAKMINYMPTAWRIPVYLPAGRGSLNCLKRSALVLQPLDNALGEMDPKSASLVPYIFGRLIRNIPVNYYTSDTMYALAKKIGRVVELAYDPKVSQTTDYVRAKVCFNVENPALEAKNLIIPEEVVVIKYEYEKIHKRCFSCLRLTHEKAHCPFLKRAQANRGGTSKEGEAIRNTQIPALLAAPLESPPGFPTMFPELSKEDRQAAMMYVSHADETERRARILRVQHSIENAKDDDTSVPIRISHNLNKDKGLVFGYSHGDDSNSESNNTNTLHAVSAPALLKDKEDRAATSGEQSASSNFQINGSTVFRLGNTTSSGYTGTSRSKRIDRKRPPAWVRK
ncbi:uncharacterized protein At4g02000-like [Brassica napus]|uniref:uncharacterized protein At4g02000-like n=1 Tax=Brassica napus TaxID=3708 RepID=UPI002078AC21|nr:uncharacterized protein At4g02000-like [Brassica napus]